MACDPVCAIWGGLAPDNEIRTMKYRGMKGGPRPSWPFNPRHFPMDAPLYQTQRSQLAP